MNITRLAVFKPIPVLVITVVTIVLGIASYFSLGNSIFPEVNFGTYIINTVYPGASAEVVEQQVTKKIEESLSGIPKLRDISSNSRANVSSVTVEFAIDADKDKTRSEVQRRVSEIQSSLPTEAGKAQMFEFDPNQQSAIEFVFSSKDNNNTELANFIKNNVEPELSKLDEVAEVRTAGLQGAELVVALKSNEVNKYGIQLTEVIDALKSVQSLPIGSIKNQDEQNQILLKTGLDAASTEQLIEKVKTKKLQTASGNFVDLKEVADVSIKQVNKDIIFRNNGKNAVQVGLLKKSDASATVISEKSRAEIDKLMKDAPKSIESKVQYDSAQETENSLKGVLESLLEGVLLTGLVLLLFLKSPKSTLIVLLSIPTSLVVTFITMKIFGFNLNILSLLGVALCIGILVDDSIVVIENIYRKLAKEKDVKEASVKGRQEIAGAAIAITLVDVAVFLPLAVLNGFIIQFFKQFAIVIVTATLASLVVSFTLTPLLSSLLLRAKKENKLLKFVEAFMLFGIPFSIIGAVVGKSAASNIMLGLGIALGAAFLIAIILLVTGLINKVINYQKVYDLEGEEEGEALSSLMWFERIIHAITSGYKKALTWSVSGWFPRLTIVGIVILSLVASVFAASNVKSEFIASSDTGLAFMTINLKETTSIDKTNEVAKKAEEYILNNKDKFNLKDVYTNLGRGNFQGSDSSVDYTLYFVNKKDRTKSSKTLVDELKNEVTKNVALPSDAKVVTAVESSGPPTNADIEYSLSGPEFEKLQEIEKKLTAKISALDYMKDVRSSVSNQVLATIVTPKDNVIGVEPLAAQGVIALNAGGFNAGKLLIKEEEVSTRIVTEGGNKSLEDIKKLPIGVNQNGIITAENGLSFDTINTYTLIQRFNKNRVIKLFGNLKEGKDTGSASQEIAKIVDDVKKEMNLSDSYKIETGGNQRQIIESFSILMLGILMSIIAIYVILAILYESLSAPLVIMLSLPTAIIGAFLALLILDKPLDLLAMIGLIILMGLVTKNGILLVDFILTARRKGESLKASIINAGELRLRPILMTTISLIVGSIPLILGAVEGAELRQSVATVFIGGLTSSLFLTLFFIPVIYSIFGSLKEKFSKKKVAN